MRSSKMFRRWFNVYDDPVVPPEEKKFTQADVDKFMAEERRKHQTKNSDLVKQYEDLKSNSALTVQQRDDLQKKIDDLQSSYMSKEQIAAQAAQKQQEEWKKSLETTTTEKDQWKSRFESTTIENALIKAADLAGAVRSEQIFVHLKDKTIVKEDKDTGTLQVLVKTTMIDPTTKKPVPVELPVEKAIEQMKGDVDLYGNLFKSTVSGGTGGSSGKRNGPVNIKDMSDAEYLAFRKEQGLARSNS